MKQEYFFRCESANILSIGCDDMVFMSMKAYEEKMYLLDVYVKLADAEEEVRTGKATEARQALKALREKHGL